MELNINKELGIMEILKDALEFFRENIQTILMTTLIVSIPVFFISRLILEIFFKSLVSVSSKSFSYSDIGSLLQTLLSFTGIMVVLGLIGGLLVTMGIAYIVSKKVKGENADYKEALQKAISKLPIGFGTSIFEGILLFILYILLILPGVYFSVMWVFATYAIVLRDKSWMKALDYSKSIVQGRWWGTFGKLVAMGIIIIIASVVITFGTGFILKFIPVEIIRSLLADSIDWLIRAFTIVATTILFLNMEATKKA